MLNIAITLFTIILLSCCQVIAKVSPDYIKKCQNLTPECLKKTMQDIIPEFSKGIPNLGIIPIDPMRQDREEYNLSGGLKITFLNGQVTGFRKCIVDFAKIENDVADVDLHCNLTVKGKYKANGRILIVTLKGDGDAKIKINNIILHAQIKLHDKTRNGVVYSEVKDYSVKHRYGDRITFGLTNLFKGNPQISQAVLTFLNDNWKQVADEFGNPIVERVVKQSLDVVKKFFHEIPKVELF